MSKKSGPQSVEGPPFHAYMHMKRVILPGPDCVALGVFYVVGDDGFVAVVFEGADAVEELGFELVEELGVELGEG